VRITLIAVGRLKESYWRDAAAEYLKRMGSYADVRVVEVADRDPGRGGEARALADETADVLKALPAGAYVITLEIAGSQLSSERFSARLGQLGLEGRSHVAFIIGGSLGLGAPVLAEADERLSFGPMTLPHNLARIVLLEQVYRAFRIARGEPYHK
jgi:23S rRNA (pseudouridine1915-N3)-methyltransferase